MWGLVVLSCLLFPLQVPRVVALSSVEVSLYCFIFHNPIFLLPSPEFVCLKTGTKPELINWCGLELPR